MGKIELMSKFIYFQLIKYKKIIQLRDTQIVELQKFGTITTHNHSEISEIKIDNPEKAKDIKLIEKLTKINKKLLKEISDTEKDKLRICEIIEKSEKENLIKKMNVIIKKR